LGSVVDLHVIHGGFGKVQIGDFVNSVISVISNHRFTDDFIFDFAFFPAFFLEVKDVIKDGILLEAS